MMNGASADFSGLGQGEAFSCQIQSDTFEAPGVKSSLDEMGVMEIEMQESENTNEATMEPYREKTQIRNKHYLVV